MTTKNILKLELNGRVFPDFVLKNYSDYILPEIVRKAGEDPCQEKIKLELTPYQRFLGHFLNYKSNFKDMLIFHGLGSGKTVSAINIYNVLFNSTPKWNIFILIPASLHDDPWLKDLDRWITRTDKEKRMKNIIFVHYDSPYADRDFLEKVKTVDASKNTLYIFDEAHNFIRNVYNNTVTKQGKRAQVIYDYIQQEKKENSNTRIIMLTATPAVNSPFEYALYYNLMRPGSFPESEAIFNQMFISSTNYESLNNETKNMFQRRIMGLTSYYLGATPDKFARKIVHYKNIEMSDYHQEIYDYFEEIEKEKEKLSRRTSGPNQMSTYLSYTRQACNFVFPTVKDISGEKRPRPGNFRIKIDDAVTIDEGKNVKKITKIKSRLDVQNYIDAITHYINTFIEYLKDLMRKDKERKHTLRDDINYFYKVKSFTELWESKRKSLLLEKLYELSPKFVHIIFNVLKSKGPVLIYSNYVEMEGLQILKVYLNMFGFVAYDSASKKDTNKKGLRFMEFHGKIDKKTRRENKNIFNSKENRYGDIMKIIMISPAGAEGINLSNVRQVHITEPYWNEVRIEQVIGRAIRQCQHSDLPMDERVVDVFRYKMIRKNGKRTSDELMEDISRKKNNLLISFTEAVKEVAVDCELFKSHNMMGTKYKCFKFNEDSLFEKVIGPAYVKKIEYDIRMDNGSNSRDSVNKRIKLEKIKAVEQLNDNVFSEEKEYWYSNETGVVYDLNSHYVVGKILKDEKGNETKLNSKIYIIEVLVNVPTTKIYD